MGNKNVIPLIDSSHNCHHMINSKNNYNISIITSLDFCSKFAKIQTHVTV